MKKLIVCMSVIALVSLAGSVMAKEITVKGSDVKASRYILLADNSQDGDSDSQSQDDNQNGDSQSQDDSSSQDNSGDNGQQSDDNSSDD